jgi:transposase
MPKRYGREFRRAICDRLVAGEVVSRVSEQSGVSVATLHLWKRQALIDAGLKPGTKSVEVDELAQAQRTIEELEAELEAVKAAVALFNGEEPVRPKGGARLPKA